MTTVLVVHAQQLIREVWISFLTTLPEIRVVAAARAPEEAVGLAHSTKPQIAIISVELILAAGISELAAIREASPDTALILVTANDPGALRARLGHVGVCAYLSKNSTLNEMETVIRQVVAGLGLPRETPASLPVLYTGRAAVDITLLTKRESDILSLLKKGKTSREIAAQLKVSFRTVEVHRYNLLRKMDCKRTSELLEKVSALIPG